MIDAMGFPKSATVFTRLFFTPLVILVKRRHRIITRNHQSTQIPSAPVNAGYFPIIDSSLSLRKN